MSTWPNWSGRLLAETLFVAEFGLIERPTTVRYMMLSVPESTSRLSPMPHVDIDRVRRGWLLGASAIGIVSGSITIVDKIALLKDPAAGSFCDISSTVGCSPVLLAWQSSVLGPPNALLGVIMFAVLATAGAVVGTGGRFVAGFHDAHARAVGVLRGCS